MNLVPPQGTVLGSLEIEEVYFYYEGPRFFAARNASGQRYLAIAVDEDEGSDTYLYVAVSTDRFRAIRSGLVSLREAYTSAEDGHAVTVKATYGDSPTNQLELRDSSEIPDAWLPTPDARLELDTPTQDPFASGDLVPRARAEQRAFIALRLVRPDGLRTEYPASALAETFGDFQEAVHAMAQEEEGAPTAAGPIPEHITRGSELAIVELRAASFVVIMSPTQEENSLLEPLARRATRRLLDLLARSGDEERLSDSVVGLRKRAISKYRALLEGVVDRDTDLGLYFAAPGEELETVTVTPAGAESGLRIATRASETSSELVIERAILIGVNLRTRAFEISEPASDDRYAGRISVDALRQIEGLPTGEAHRYSIRLLVEQAYVSFSSEPSTKYRLLSIAPLEVLAVKPLPDARA